VAARHFRLPKSTEPILFSQRCAKSANGREREREGKGWFPGRKREKTNKFAANRPLKTPHANGSRGNFKFYDSESRRCDIHRLSRLPSCLATPTPPTQVTPAASLALLAVSASTRRIQPSPSPPSVPLKSSRSPSAEIVRAQGEDSRHVRSVIISKREARGSLIASLLADAIQVGMPASGAHLSRLAEVYVRPFRTTPSHRELGRIIGQRRRSCQAGSLVKIFILVVVELYTRARSSIPLAVLHRCIDLA